MDMTYRISLQGIKTDADVQIAHHNLGKLFSATPEQVAQMLSPPNYVLKGKLSAEAAAQYQAAIEAAGFNCLIEKEIAEQQSLPADLPAEIVAHERPTNSTLNKPKSEPEQPMHWGTAVFGLIFAILVVGFMHREKLGLQVPDVLTLGSGDSAAKGIADQMIKKHLTSPGSYRVVRQEVIWSKTVGKDTAHIVRTEYDASNAFGAALRDCIFTSFIDKGEQFTFDPLFGRRKCFDNRDSPKWEADKAALIATLSEDAGLARFTERPTPAKPEPVKSVTNPATVPLKTQVEPGAEEQSQAVNATLEYESGTIFLGPECSAISSQYGKGKWQWANGGITVDLDSGKNIGLARMESPYRDGRCATPPAT